MLIRLMLVNKFYTFRESPLDYYKLAP